MTKAHIYISHSSQFDYQNELYLPLKASELGKNYSLILPHRKSTLPVSTKTVIENACLFIAEISYPSTGQGIELGWANIFKVPIICLHKKEQTYSSSIKIICEQILSYEDLTEFLAESSFTSLCKTKLKLKSAGS